VNISADYEAVQETDLTTRIKVLLVTILPYWLCLTNVIM